MITDKERIVLNAVVNSDYQDYPDEIIGHPVWTFSLYDAHKAGIKGKILSGVISSLVSKGLVTIYHDRSMPDEDKTIAITEKGWEALQPDKKGSDY